MARNILWQLYFLLNSWLGFSQSIESEYITPLPSELKECSGMVFLDSARIAMINDGGNDPELFILDTAGSLLETVSLEALENVDWESMASNGRDLFIGDFGNNANQRRDLSVYVLSAQDFRLKRQLKFYYPEQSGFPPADSARYYDLEAMIYRRDSLLLFTKNRTKPFNAQVKVYYLDPHREEQAATLIHEFPIGKGLMQFNWVCGASSAFKADDLVLIGYQYLWYIPEFQVNKPVHPLRYDLGYFSQKEAVSLRGDQLYFTEESRIGSPGALHRIDLGFLKNYQNGKDIGASLPEKHFKDSLEIHFSNPGAYQGVIWRVYAKNGTVARSDTLRFLPSEKGIKKLDLNPISRGSHLLSVDHYLGKQVFIIYRD